MKRCLLSLLLVVCSAAALADMPRMNLNVGMYRIDAEVASDNPNRMQGLMHRKAMAPHQGMLFVFPQVATHCMWMRNTFLPLSVAFLDETGKIINIEDMEPQTENNHCAAKPARFALEMNKGWFASKKIKAGTVIKGVDQAPAPR
ncbi:MAG TPA: DUF192 domain-containing protein [Rhodocyclaceae bacterium]|nr:DUF192 domain-containing protein [Rhodocyclaceae bacterium]